MMLKINFAVIIYFSKHTWLLAVYQARLNQSKEEYYIHYLIEFNENYFI